MACSEAPGPKFTTSFRIVKQARGTDSTELSGRRDSSTHADAAGLKTAGVGRLVGNAGRTFLNHTSRQIRSRPGAAFP
jgi:hypothetical protein